MGTNNPEINMLDENSKKRFSYKVWENSLFGHRDRLNTILQFWRYCSGD